MMLPMEIIGLLVAGVALIAAVVTYSAALRYIRTSIVAGFSASLGVGLVLIAAAHLVLPWSVPASAAAHVIQWAGDCLLYLCGWYVFMNFVVCSESSIRVRLLRDIVAAGGQIRESDLLAAYNERALIAMRLERLVAGRQIRDIKGRFFPAARGLMVLGLLLQALKRLILRKSSEFD